MSSTITTEPRDPAPPPGWKQGLGPSLIRDDDLNLPRFIGLISAVAVIFGGFFLTSARMGRPLVGPTWATFWLALGLAGLLFHAAMDRDIQFRRLYGIFAALGLVLGIFLCLLPYERTGDLFGPGFGLMFLSLLFVMAFLRNEDDPSIRQKVQLALGGAGLVFAIVGMIGGNLSAEFLVGSRHAPFGLLLALLGLVYLCASVSVRGTDPNLTYLGGLAVGGLGLLIILLALLRSIWVPLVSGGPESYFYPTGMLLLILGVSYSLASAFLCSDNRVVVMTRRELGAFFFSPIAYIVLLAFTVGAWLSYYFFIDRFLPVIDPRFGLIYPAMREPIVVGFFLQWPPILCILFGVPALTMRLLSEEKRTGTLEVLLTTPTDEVSLVASKFLAALAMYLIFWIPFALFLVALRVIGGQEFEYKPLLAFSIVLTVTGANFVAMGLFFSSLTSNQIISGVLTFAGMLVLTMVFLIRSLFLRSIGEETIWAAVLKQASFIDLWIETLSGQLAPMYLLFHASMAFLWLFGTVKVLEARKWS